MYLKTLTNIKKLYVDENEKNVVLKFVKFNDTLKTLKTSTVYLINLLNMDMCK